MSFANALKSAQAKNTLRTPKDVDPPIAKQWRATPDNRISRPMWPNIEVSLSRKRIELYFDNKPNQIVLDQLKANRFWWDRVVKCWHNFDTPAVRSFLEDTFCADFGSDPEYKSEQNYVMDEPALVQAAKEHIATLSDHDRIVQDKQGATISPSDTAEPSLDTSSPLAVYRRQVDELLAHLQIAPADLILVAIDSLHKATFSRDS